MTRSFFAASAALSVFVGLSLACVGTDGTSIVQGDRAASGECPPGETCSDLAESGLLFVGQMLYDEGSERLGPVLVNGRFDLTFIDLGGNIEGFDVTIEGQGLEAVERLEEPGGVSLVGTEPGTAMVRIVDPETGELYDRLPLDVVTIDGVEVHNVSDRDRTVLYAGCEEMIGIHLLAEGGSLRAFDQNVRVLAPVEVVPDPGVWDCFRYQVPQGEALVEIEIEAGGETWTETVPVEPLPEGTECPALSD